jgi:hypothetical protein
MSASSSRRPGGRVRRAYDDIRAMLAAIHAADHTVLR